MEDFYRQYPRGAPDRKEVPLSSPRRVRDLLPYLRSPVLDVGCSKGYDVDYFSHHGFQVEGCDVSGEAVERALENYPGRTFFVHDFERGPAAKRYNSAYAFDVVEHVFDYPRFLENIRSSLNPGGTLILATPNVLGLKNRIRFLLGDGEYFKQIPHIRYFTPETLGRTLEEAGFKVLKVLGYSSVPLPVSLCGSLTAISEAIG
ncbi:MAG: class I SAM-dependent methyltransferase [Euryarchaeota archaeon]|nr:class I SAM-dependent methyltransferase [Euryarchaeota archaeon]